MAFNNIELAELENIGCKCTPYMGYRGNLYFYAEKKEIILDEYVYNKYALIRIYTQSVNFEQLINKLNDRDRNV